jgi:hypothetical protein
LRPSGLGSTTRPVKDDRYAHAPRLPDTPSIDLRTLVDSGGRPVELELGPGRGWFIIERLEAEPTATIIGLEIRRKWATIVDERLKKRGLGQRARVFAEDARLGLPKLVAASVARVFVSFPDPGGKTPPKAPAAHRGAGRRGGAVCWCPAAICTCRPTSRAGRNLPPRRWSSSPGWSPIPPAPCSENPWCRSPAREESHRRRPPRDPAALAAALSPTLIRTETGAGSAGHA